MKRLLVVGASGDVGQGILAAACEKGWKVAASGRNAARLESVAAPYGARVLPIQGSIATAEAAEELWKSAHAALGGIEAVVISVNAPVTFRPMMEWSPDELAEELASNVLSHFLAAKLYHPRLPPQGCYVGLGGGMADFLPPKGGHHSMSQAALRMMYRAAAKEAPPGLAALRELQVISMVNGASKRAVAQPNWVTDRDVGRHVCAIIENPERFPGPILALKSSVQAGRPDVEDAAAPS